MQPTDRTNRLTAWSATVGAVLLAVAGGWWGPALGSGDDAEQTPGASAVPPQTAATAEAAPRTRRTVRQPRPGADGEERLEYEPAVLRIVTNFKKADATVNGIPYPEYTEPGDQPGMVLPAGGPYKVTVNYNGNKKVYTIGLDPYEVRYLIVELSGYEGGAPAGSASTTSSDSAKATQSDGDGQGRVTVYSKPKGTIHVDGSAQGQKTPGTIKVAPGQHDVQVKFDNGKMSESKTVRVRKGSRIKLFFRKSG